MLDIQLLRTNLDAVATRLAKRGYVLDTASFAQLEAARKDNQTATERLQSQRNALSRQIGQAKAKGDEKLVAETMARVAEFGAKLKEEENTLGLIQAKLRDFLERIPNTPHESVPSGGGPEGNVELRRWGSPRRFDFSVKDHVDVGEDLGMLDLATATKIAGARFSLLKGALARLHDDLLRIGMFEDDGQLA